MKKGVCVMNKFALAVSVFAVGLGLQSAAYAGYTTVPVFATSTYAYGTMSYARGVADNMHQYIGCAVYPNITTNATTQIECKARSAAGGNFWCYLANPDPAMVSAVGSVNQSELSFLQVRADRQNHCTNVTATTLVGSSERAAQRRDALQPIDVLIARGQWGAGELISFHDKLGDLDTQQHELAMQKLARVINSGSVEDVILSTN